MFDDVAGIKELLKMSCNGNFYLLFRFNFAYCYQPSGGSKYIKIDIFKTLKPNPQLQI